jgi:hypothetical protein
MSMQDQTKIVDSSFYHPLDVASACGAAMSSQTLHGMTFLEVQGKPLHRHIRNDVKIRQWLREILEYL